MLFIVQRSDGTAFTPASEIDPAYARKLEKAHKAGVEIFIYGTRINPKQITIAKKIVLVF